jgi:hypothetical protein
VSLAGCRRSGAMGTGVLLPYTGPFRLYGKPMDAALRARVAKVANGKEVAAGFAKGFTGCGGTSVRRTSAPPATQIEAP